MKKHLLTAGIVANLALIWGNSLMTGADSGNLSGGVLAFLGSLFPMLLSEAGHFLLRKLAHFSEFGLLGLLTSTRYGLDKGTLPWWLSGFGLAVACVDETIQIFTPGRASSLMDVWIDFSGFVLGFVVIKIAHTIKTKTKKGEQLP